MMVLAWMGVGGWWDVLGADGGEGGLGWMSRSSAKRTPLVVGGFGAFLMPLFFGWVRGWVSFSSWPVEVLVEASGGGLGPTFCMALAFSFSSSARISAR